MYARRRVGCARCGERNCTRRPPRLGGGCDAETSPPSVRPAELTSGTDLGGGRGSDGSGSDLGEALSLTAAALAAVVAAAAFTASAHAAASLAA